LQVQGLQRQPADLQVHGLQRHPLFSVFSIVILLFALALIRPAQTIYGVRTMVRNQAKNSDTIGGLAKAAGVGVETIRYYQRRGLLAEPPRPHGEVRRYSDEDLRRLKFIRSAQTAGFTLAEIGELLELSASDDRPRARELAGARIAALDEKIAEMKVAREALAGLATACAKGRKGPCPILDAFEPK
jgi:MerR family mercuric resistance operon transcriptional regulator